MCCYTYNLYTDAKNISGTVVFKTDRVSGWTFPTVKMIIKECQMITFYICITVTKGGDILQLFSPSNKVGLVVLLELICILPLWLLA